MMEEGMLKAFDDRYSIMQSLRWIEQQTLNAHHYATVQNSEGEKNKRWHRGKFVDLV